ncbi:hypothetical protein [Spirosoma flavus]
MGVLYLLRFFSLIGQPSGAFSFIAYFWGMEVQPDQPTPQADLIKIQKQRLEDATDFLSICDRLSTGYDSGYYWEDVQRALRIAAGLEEWPD